MQDPHPRLYEGLFLVNQNAVASDFEGCIQHLRDIFKRAEAEVLVLKKWAETKLAYEIRGQKRGTFLLAYFKTLSNQLGSIERDCRLSEKILRYLVLRADHVGDVELELAKKEEGLHLEVQLRGYAPVSDVESELPEDEDEVQDVKDTAEVQA